MGYSLTYTPYNTNLFLNNGGIDPATQAFVTAAGITNLTQIAAVNNLVVSLKNDGLWSKMKAVYPFVTDNKNLLSYTEDFNNIYWGSNFTSITQNLVAPNGSTTGSTIVNNGGSNRSIVRGIPVVSGQTYTLSFWIKKISGAFVNPTAIQLTSWGPAVAAQIYTDIGTTLTTDWVRYTHTFTAISTNTAYVQLISNELNTMGVWGAQLELGSTATTYQPIATTQQAYIANQFKYNLVNPLDTDAAFRLVFNGGWTHSSTGATPNGVNGYADTKLSPLSVFSTNDSISFGYYTRNIPSPGAYLVAEMGAANSDITNGLFMIGTYTGNNTTYSRVADSFTNAFVSVPAPGLYNLNRTSSTNYKIIRNGVILSTPAVNSTGRTANNMWIGGHNYGTSFDYGVGQCAFSYISDGLSDTEAANLYTRVQAFQTALSRQV